MDLNPSIHRQEPLTKKQAEEQASKVAAIRAEAARELVELAPTRFRVLQACSPLADIESAMDCSCTCHPQVSSTHDGGSSCPCQLSGQERERQRREAFATLLSVSEEVEAQLQRQQDEEAAHMGAKTAELGVTVRHWGGAAPFVLRGEADGRGFYFRERHEKWSVTIGPDDNPTADPWSLESAEPVITVARGDTAELIEGGRLDPVACLEASVRAVRLFLLRRQCDHKSAERFCPACGVEMAFSALWKITTSEDSPVAGTGSAGTL